MNYILEGEDLFKEVILRLKNIFIPTEDNDHKAPFLQSNILLYAVLALLLVRIFTIGAYVPFSKNIFFADIIKTDLVNLLNQDRQNLGLSTLNDNSALDQAAMLKAQDMVSKDYFAHQSPQGTSPWFWFRQVGYNYKYAGENLAVGFVDSSEVFNAWLNSPGHRANIVNPNYKDVGTAIVSGFGNNGAILVVQIFGSAQPVVAAKTVTPTNINKPILAAPVQTDTTEIAPVQNPSIEAPAQAQVEPPAPDISDAKVLGNATTNQIIPATTKARPSNFYSKAINAILYNYQNVLAYTSYLLLLLISVSLLIHLWLNMNAQSGPLVAKSLVMVAVLVGIVVINKHMVLGLIPHQLII